MPLTEATKGILNLQLFKQLNKNGYLINVGRGKHLIEKDLLNALDNNLLSGAILDVFHNEPLQNDHPFWKHEKIFITPHCASLTDPKSVIQQVLENYRRAKSDRDILHKINRKKEY